MSLFDRIANAIAPAYGHAQSSAYWVVVVLVGIAAFAGLLYGRRFFWIFAGLVGFVVGQFISGFLVAPLPYINSLFELAIGAGFGLLAIAFPWTVALVFVFVGTGVAAAEIASLLFGIRLLYWVIAPVAGFLAVRGLRTKFEEAMVLLTAFYSALLLTFVLREVAPNLTRVQVLLALLILLSAGIIKQGFDLRKERRDPYRVPVSAGGIAPEKLQ